MSNAKGLSRESYKTIKHMNKSELTAYLDRVYARGYSDGFKAGKAEVDTPADQGTDAPAEE